MAAHTRHAIAWIPEKTAGDQQHPPSPSTKPQPPTALLHLAALSLTTLTTGLAITSLPTLTTKDNPLSPTTTHLPFLLATILTAALFDPLLRRYLPPPSVPTTTTAPTTIPQLPLLPILALATLLTTTAHVLSFPILLSPSRLPLPITLAIEVVRSTLLGSGCTLVLTMGVLACDGAVGKMGLVFGMGVGGATGGALLRIGLGDGLGGLVAGVVGGLVFVFVAVVGLGGKWRVGSGGEDAEGGRECEQGKRVIGRDGYPPPPSGRTVLAAVFVLVYSAAVVAVPESLGFGRVTAAGFWSGFGVGCFMLLLPGSQQLKHSVPLALILVAGMLLLAWFVPGTLGTSTGGAALVGLVLGPVAPWTMAMLVSGMSEDEKPSGVAIVIAFGTSGAVVGLVAVQLAAYLGMPGALRWAIMGLFSAMLLCWRTMVGVEGRV